MTRSVRKTLTSARLSYTNGDLGFEVYESMTCSVSVCDHIDPIMLLSYSGYVGISCRNSVSVVLCMFAVLGCHYLYIGGIPIKISWLPERPLLKLLNTDVGRREFRHVPQSIEIYTLPAMKAQVNYYFCFNDFVCFYGSYKQKISVTVQCKLFSCL